MRPRKADLWFVRLLRGDAVDLGDVLGVVAGWKRGRFGLRCRVSRGLRRVLLLASEGGFLLG